jgi:hypothetical protein
MYVYVCTLMHMHACVDVHLYFLNYQWLVSIVFTIFSLQVAVSHLLFSFSIFEGPSDYRTLSYSSLSLYMNATLYTFTEV